MTAILGQSSLGFVYYAGSEVCQSQCDIEVCTFVAFSLLSHGPNPDSSSINKETKFLVKGFYVQIPGQ